MILKVDNAADFRIGNTISIGWYDDDSLPTEYIIVGIRGNDIEVVETYEMRDE